jgi:hypothetical protein
MKKLFIMCVVIAPALLTPLIIAQTVAYYEHHSDVYEKQAATAEAAPASANPVESLKNE